MQSLKKFLISISAIVLFSAILAAPSIFADVIVTNVITETFSYDLQVGSEGQDVLKLQKFLNAYEDTAVAFSGTGSRGYESTSFGGLTKAAVIKFQNKYAITPADGYVGLSTRTKINELYPTTNFNLPYPPKTVVITKKDTSADTGINLCQFIDLLIAIDAIKPEKASQARGLVSGCTGNNPALATNDNTAPKTSDYWNNLPKYVDTTNVSTDTLDSYYDSLSNLSLYQDNSTSTFTGNKSLGDVRRFAVFAGGSLTNTNNADFYVATTTSTSTQSSSRTFIDGDVGALTEQAVPLRITGKNEYNLGARTQQLSALNKAIELANKLPCDYNFTASSTDIGGRTLGPGTYCFTGDIVVSNTVTLSNPASTTNPKATTTGLYIFRTKKDLKTVYSAASVLSTTTSSTTAKLATSVQYKTPNTGFDAATGLPPYSVFWITDGNVNIAENTIFLGTVMTKTGYINVGENTEIPEGRVLTRTAIALNKNMIKTPPDPVKVTVTLGGDSDGSVSGPNMSCSSKKGSVSTSPTGTTTKGTRATCQAYYKLGETVTLSAKPVSSEDPKWTGCDKSSGKSCTVNIKKDIDLSVEFFLDTFSGLSLPYPPWFVLKLPCITTPGFLFVVAGEKPGIFVVRGLRNLQGWVPFAPVMGTLEDYNQTSCFLPTGKSAGPFRIVEDMRFGL